MIFRVTFYLQGAGKIFIDCDGEEGDTEESVANEIFEALRRVGDGWLFLEGSIVSTSAIAAIFVNRKEGT